MALGLVCIPIAFVTYAFAVKAMLAELPLWAALALFGVHVIAWLAVAAMRDHQQENLQPQEPAQ